MKVRSALVSLGLALWAGSAPAQQVFMCEGSPIPKALEELSADAYRSFADGNIRVFDIYVDSNLPSSVLIGVLHPAPSTLSDAGTYQTCSAIYSQHDGLGYFGQVFLGKATAEYDPEAGLTLKIPVRYDYQNRPSEDGLLSITVNQATGEIQAQEN